MHSWISAQLAYAGVFCFFFPLIFELAACGVLPCPGCDSTRMCIEKDALARGAVSWMPWLCRACARCA